MIANGNISQVNHRYKLDTAEAATKAEASKKAKAEATKKAEVVAAKTKAT